MFFGQALLCIVMIAIFVALVINLGKGEMGHGYDFDRE